MRWTCACILLLTIGCAPSLVRPHETTEQLLVERAKSDAARDQGRRDVVARNLRRIKGEEDAFEMKKTTAPPVVDILVISGGGDWGAFGAGFLKGWGKVHGDLARPSQFDVVTGVSTGALIAPFAFLGDEQSIDEIENFYRNPKPNWFVPRGIVRFLLTGRSYAKIPGLEKELHDVLTPDMLKRLAAAEPGGRALVVTATSVDMQEMHLWDITEEAKVALAKNDPDHVRQILLASSAVPGAFPPRFVDGELFIDGGISGNIFYGDRALAKDSFATAWQAAYPKSPPPKLRFWIIFNNEFRPAPEQVSPLWPNILGKASTTATRCSTLNAIRLLFAQAQIARLTHQDQIEVRVVAIPDGWVPPRPGFFDKETMNVLADMGEKMGADPNSWRTTPP